MKAKFSPHFSLVLLSVLLFSNSFAQKDFSNVASYRYSATQLTAAFPAPESKLISTEVVSGKILKRFNKTFKNADNIKWEQLDDNFLATFVTDNIITKSLYDKKGNLIYTINYSSEKELPVNIKNMVVNNYKNYSITSVARILQDNQKIWIIKLAGKTNYAAIRIENDTIEEIENFQKNN